MTTSKPVRMSSEEVQTAILAFLRQSNYVPQRTSEISKALGFQPSCVRRAGLALVSRGVLQADLVKGRGRGEYLFILQQLDLFYDQKPAPSLSLNRILEALAEVKTKLLMLTLRRRA